MNILASFISLKLGAIRWHYSVNLARQEKYELMDPLTRLQNWYFSHCDGDWEHSFGIAIGTLDNPGWSLKINLVGTSCSGRDFTRYSVGDSDIDVSWYVCWVAENHFEAAGGPLMLGEMIKHFLKWAEAE